MDFTIYNAYSRPLFALPWLHNIADLVVDANVSCFRRRSVMSLYLSEFYCEIGFYVWRTGIRGMALKINRIKAQTYDS